MILIADSGSSKTDWRLIDGQSVEQLSCKGLNPDFNSSEMVADVVKETFREEHLNQVSEIHFYGSGCSSDSRNEIVKVGLQTHFKQASIHIYHDVLGAARATCGKQEGLAGILGTGSNCCLFDGTNVVKEYRTGGFIIGDEGGGVYLGRLLVKAFIEDRLPQDLREKFNKRYQLTVDDILVNLYKKDYPNRFLASFSQFLFHHREHPFIAEIIYKNFDAYFDHQVLRYEQAKRIPLNLVGSIAFYYQEVIRTVAQNKGIVIGTILEKPIAGLTLYHTDLSG